MVDPIADFLTQIRNAQGARRTTVEIPYSKMKHDIAHVMHKNKFLDAVQKDSTGKFPVLKLTLPTRRLTLKRVSHCGQRMYIKSGEIRKILNGFGIAVISTSQGVMTGYEARSKNIGGEYLCEIS